MLNSIQKKKKMSEIINKPKDGCWSHILLTMIIRAGYTYLLFCPTLSSMLKTLNFRVNSLVDLPKFYIAKLSELWQSRWIIHDMGWCRVRTRNDRRHRWYIKIFIPLKISDVFSTSWYYLNVPDYRNCYDFFPLLY